ncbi:MAG: division/cell wall cluster transcriptional repressor MraZ [Firmicutes bacterium]|nr:division/cell wall cluster transcriptional repressor MraZ [Bacillota bacterium]
MFLGEFQHALDDKGRLTIPARFREGLGQRFVVTRGLDGCLFVYPQAEWQVLESRLKALPLTRGDARAFVRFLFSGACECELDRQGRVMLPPPLREYAGLEKDVVVIGVSNRVEIWAAARWAGYVDKAAQSFAEIAEKLEGLIL